MRVYSLDDMTGGWFVGSFSPTAYEADFEVGVARHTKGQVWKPHYHRECDEINLLMKGKMRMQDQILNPGDIFVIPPYEIADPEFLEDCIVIVVKSKSNPDDKQCIEKV